MNEQTDDLWYEIDTFEWVNCSCYDEAKVGSTFVMVSSAVATADCCSTAAFFPPENVSLRSMVVRFYTFIYRTSHISHMYAVWSNQIKITTAHSTAQIVSVVYFTKQGSINTQRNHTERWNIWWNCDATDNTLLSLCVCALYVDIEI